MKFTIQGELPSLNEHDSANRANKYLGASLKRVATHIVYIAAKEQKLKPIASQVTVNIVWFCKNKKKDPDNIAFAKKYILDGLVIAGVLIGDGWKQIKGFTDEFRIDKNERVEVQLETWE